LMENENWQWDDSIQCEKDVILGQKMVSSI